MTQQEARRIISKQESLIRIHALCQLWGLSTREFCSWCGASIPPRYGEGTCNECDPKDKRMSLIIVLRNKSSLAPVSDYDYEVMVGDGTPARSTSLEHGEVIGHKRDEGWEMLMEHFMKNRKKHG